jgi:hypothetical protein
MTLIQEDNAKIFLVAATEYSPATIQILSQDIHKPREPKFLPIPNSPKSFGGEQFNRREARGIPQVK